MERKERISKLLAAAWSFRSNGNYDDSRLALEEAIKLCNDDDYSYLGRIHHILMQYEADQDQFEKAIEYCKISKSYYELSQDKDRIAHSNRHLADLYYNSKEFDLAEQYYVFAVQIYRSRTKSHPGDLANALRGYSYLLEQKGETGKAIQIWNEVLEIYAGIGVEDGILEARQKIKDLNDKL